MANFETIKLDKGLYHTSKGFLNELESIDPSEKYKGTSLEGLDAFERQLKRFDIKIKGANSDPIEKFFATTVFETQIPRNIRLAEAPSYGEPICLYDKSCVGAKAYLKLTEEYFLRNNVKYTK